MQDSQIFDSTSSKSLESKWIFGKVTNSLA